MKFKDLLLCVLLISLNFHVEQLANSLRLEKVVPSVQAAVFLCFRVLLLRMSPDHVTSLWPIIIAEMVQVLLSIEQELKTDTEEFRWVFFLSSSIFASCFFLTFQDGFVFVCVGFSLNTILLKIIQAHREITALGWC